jgi:hypothetical protein
VITGCIVVNYYALDFVWDGHGPFVIFIATFLSLLGFVMMIIAQDNYYLAYLGMIFGCVSIVGIDHNLSLMMSEFFRADFLNYHNTWAAGADALSSAIGKYFFFG